MSLNRVVIKWLNKNNYAQGVRSGQDDTTEDIAKAWCEKLNKEYPYLEHWYEPVENEKQR